MCLLRFFKCFLHVFILFFGVNCALIASNDLMALDPLPDLNNNYYTVLLTVGINGQEPAQIVYFLQDSHDNLYVNKDDLEAWSVILPTKSPLFFEGEAYYPLNNLAGVEYTININEQSIALNISPDKFKPNQITFDKMSFMEPTKPGFGLILDYTTLAQKDDFSHQLSGLFTPSVFSPYGSIVSEFLAVNNNYYDDEDNNQNRIIRLNSSWRQDDTKKMNTRIIGDSFSSTGLWGNSVGFGGIQFTSNYSLQPGFITYPLPRVHGEALLPSTVDLYTNGALLGNTTVDQSGLFSIDSIPVVNGYGMLEVVTTDLLGREQVISVPFYTSTQLLQPGLEQYSYEFGFIRENFSISSNDYGPFLSTLTHRRGFTTNFTGGVHAELLRDQQAIGLEGAYLLGTFLELNAAAAVSNSDNGTGKLSELALTHRNAVGFSYGMTLQATTPHFAQLGLFDDTEPPSLQTTAFIGVPGIKGYATSVAYTQQNNRGGDDFQFMSAAVSKTFFDDLSFGLTGLVGLNSSMSNSVVLSVTKSLGNNTYASGGFLSQQDSDNSGYFQLNKPLDLAPSVGYNLYSQQGAQENYQATLLAQNNIGTYSVAAAKTRDNTGYQAQAAGSAVNIGKNWYLTRDIYDSFALVRLPGYSNVRVYVENQEITRTDENGDAFVPVLLSYQNNTIAIAENDLPIDVEVANNQLNVVPYYNSGLIIDFPLQSLHGAVVSIYSSDDKPIPPGTVIEYISREQFYVVVNDGEVYLTNLLPGKNYFNVFLDGDSCQFSIDYELSQSPLPDLGKVICE